MKENRRCFIDTHTHILPKLDDGSRSSEESLRMLGALYDMGACGVILTPHFYARSDEPEEFLSSREQTAEHFIRKIKAAHGNEGALPRLYLGAEVEYFNAMSICPDLERLCIGGTRYLLCEMPFYRWTGAMIDELRIIKKKCGITPIIAHIERYFGFFKPSMLDEMIEEGFIIQSNAESFIRFGRRRVLKMLEEGRIHLLGSDCHNMEKRAPNIGAALDVIEKKLGADAVEKLCKRSLEVFEGAEAIYP